MTQAETMSATHKADRATKAADQKFCHSCGYVLHHSASNCPGCGALQGTAALAPYQTPASLAIAGVPTALAPHHVYCRGCGAGIHESAHTCPKCGAPQRLQGAGTGSGKSKTTAAVLALLLGGVGAHKFYLGQIVWGLIYLVFCLTFIPALVAFIEGIYYLSMSDEEFARKF